MGDKAIINERLKGNLIMKQMTCKGIAVYLLAGFTIIVAVCLSMFSNWEMSGETWGYWYFARVFAETGGFIVPDRSPLYTLYLNLFIWIPYPASVTAEYLVTTSITVGALVAFFRRYLGVWLALIAACLWILYLQMAEPPIQKLALASSLVAVLLRGDEADRFRLAVSYAFLILAYFFRQTYILMIVVFLSYDALRTIRERGIRTWFSWRPKLASDWPLLLVSILFFWFLFCQSSSPWNNVWCTNTEWFPNDGKTIARGGGVQNFNWRYIELKYGTFEGHDFYFTNREAFGGATSIVGMFFANPYLFLKIVSYNIKDLVPNIMVGIPIPETGTTLIDYLFYLFKLSLLICIMYGAYRAARNGPTKTLIVGSLVMVGVTVISIPKWRYMFPLIPVFIMAVSWYGAILTAFLKKLYPSAEKLLQRMAIAIFAVGILSLLFYSITDFSTNPLRVTVFLAGMILTFFCAFALLIAARFAKAHMRIAMSRFALALPTILLMVIFSGGNISGWAAILHNACGDFGSGRLHFLEDRKVSIKAAYPALAHITQSCRGIMSLEPTFFGAFLDIPQSRVYAVWEIPPFGHLGDAVYNGLIPDRIDCVFISTNLATGIGAATNYQIRYKNYIKPYVNQLQTLGATTYELPYGQAVVLRK